MAFVDASPWGVSLTSAERVRVEASLRCSVYQSGEAIALAGCSAEYWVGILEGLVVQSITLKDGRELFLSAVCEGAWFGEGTLIKREHWQYDAIAIRSTKVVLLPASVFHYLRDTSIAFNQSLQEALNERLSSYTEMAVVSRTGRAIERVEGAIRRLMVNSARPIRISQSELGLLVGLSRQRTNLAVRELTMRGILSVDRNGITVADAT